MSDYNDGNWHGWNGGECPVHPKSVVSGIEQSGTRWQAEAFANDWSSFRGAFRVVEVYCEPRTFWVKFYPDGPKIVHHGAAGAFMVREVIE